MRSSSLQAWLFATALSAGCGLLIDVDTGEIGGLAEDAGLDASQPGDPGHVSTDSGASSPTEDAGPSHPCDRLRCDRDEQCVLSGGNPVCVEIPGAIVDASAHPNEGEACGSATCDPGQVCCNASCGICTWPGWFCIQRVCDDDEPEPPSDSGVEPPEEPETCDDCEPGTYCDPFGGEVRCIPFPSCDDVECEDGTHCELQEVECERDPCPPQPECVKDVPVDPCSLVDCEPCKVVNGRPFCVVEPVCPDPCEGHGCNGNSHCEAVEVDCVTEPCCPVAECVPDCQENGSGLGGGPGPHCER